MHGTGIRIEGLKKRYGSGDTAVDALKGVDMQVAPGEVVGLIGPSGSGKSTLLKCLGAVIEPSAGRMVVGDEVIYADGWKVGDLRALRRDRIGFVFQAPYLIPFLDVTDNVALLPMLAGMPNAEARARARDMLESLDVQHRARAMPSQLSGGEQQRVAIARALAPEPAAILMDEPFSGLDPSLRDSVRDAALDAIRAAGIPALLVTHDPAEALEHADRIAIMSQGKLLQEGPAREIYTQPVSAAVAGALGPVNRFTAGDVPAGLLTGQAPGAMILVRPEGVCIDPASGIRARVLSARMTGPLTRLTLDLNGLKMTALVPPVTEIVPGMEIGVRLDPALTFTFASGEV